MASDFQKALNTLAVILLIESVVIIVTNTLVFVLFAKCKKLRRKSNYCLVSLAVADILVALLVIPLIGVCNYSDCPLCCAGMDITQRALYYSMIFHILLATVDRYLKIRNPFRYRTIITSGRIIGTLVAIWVISTGVALVLIASPFTSPFRTLYIKITLVIMACIPFVIILILNVHTRWIVSKNDETSRKLSNAAANENNARPKQQRTVLVYLVMATVTFIFGPLLYFLMSNWAEVQFYYWVMVVSNGVRFSVHFITPLLYTFFKTDFRNALKDMVHGQNASDEQYTVGTSLRNLSTRSSSRLSEPRPRANPDDEVNAMV